MIETDVYRGIAITRSVIIRHPPSQIEGQSVGSRINDRLRLSFNSNGRNAILIEESSWLLEWNRTIWLIFLSLQCIIRLLHGCIYGKFKCIFDLVLSRIFDYCWIYIYIAICLSIDRIRFFNSNFSISFEGNDT